MALSKAAPKQARLKIGLYGPPGSGKTFSALLLAEGLAAAEGKRIAYFDTERGTDFYAQAVPTRRVHPEAFDFDALYTRSLALVSEEVRALDSDKYGVVVIDSISHLWDAAIEAYQGKRTKADTIPFNAWAAIKKPYKGLIKFLLDSHLHVLILGRQKNIFEDVDGETRKVGVGMRAEGETEYEPHICIRMETKKGDKEATVYAYVEKDRTGILSGKIIPNPSFDTFRPLLPLLGAEQAQSEDPEETALRDSELLAQDGDKAKAKEERSSALYADFNSRLVAAKTMEDLGAIAADLKKQRRYIVDAHLDGLRVMYEERRKVVGASLAPSEV